MLGNSSSFTGDNIGLTNMVKQRCFTMVNVTHHRNNRRSRHHILWRVLFSFNGFNNFHTHKLHFVAKLLSNNGNCFSIQSLVNWHKHTQAHTGTDNLIYLNIHHRCQLTSRNKLRNLQHLLVLSLFHRICFHLLANFFAFLLAVLRCFWFSALVT